MTDNPTPKGGKWVYTRWITKKGKRIYPKNGKFFRFWVDK